MKKCVFCGNETEKRCFIHGISICENCNPVLCKSCQVIKCERCYDWRRCVKCNAWICKFCADESKYITSLKYAVYCNDCLFERYTQLKTEEEIKRQRAIDEEYANWIK
jgi:hypothetical protein